MLNRSVAISFVAGLSILLQSCVAIPISSEELLSDEKSAHLRIGLTTREEIHALFGEPDYENADESSVLYSRVRREWLIILSPGQPEPGAGEVEENLYVEFDDRNLLRHFELVEFVDRKACAKNGICMIQTAIGRHTVFTRSPSVDQHAKQFHTLPEDCSVYLYGDVSIEDMDDASAWHTVCQDDQPVIATLYSPDLYLHRSFPAGMHHLTLQNAWAWDWGFGSAAYGYLGNINRGKDDWKRIAHTIDCKPGEIYFLRIKEIARSEKANKEDGADWIYDTKYVSTEFSLESVSAETGQAMIRDKEFAADWMDISPEPDADTDAIRHFTSNCAIFGQ